MPYVLGVPLSTRARRSLFLFTFLPLLLADETMDISSSSNGQRGREWMGPYMQAEAMNLATGALEQNLNLPSNRAMKKPEQRLYNGGVHWVSG